MSEFFVGQKVVCVDDSPASHPGLGDWVKRGAIYAVARVGILTSGNLGLDLSGLDMFQTRVRFRADRFRPLEETSKTIEQFREIARGVSNGKPIIEDAEWRMPTPEKVKA